MSCMCLCKDTNFKANHNKVPESRRDVAVVCAYAKILILKQITTLLSPLSQKKALYVPMQRY